MIKINDAIYKHKKKVLSSEYLFDGTNVFRKLKRNNGELKVLTQYKHSSGGNAYVNLRTITGAMTISVVELHKLLDQK